MSNKIWDDKTTDFPLNGPEMSITTDTTRSVTSVAPNGQTGDSSDATSQVFSGVATCTFDHGAATDGRIVYQWYEVGGSAVGVSTRWSGQSTNTLTINYALSPEDNGKQYYFQASYVPGAVDGDTYSDSTGEPISEPVSSTPSTLNVLPELFIASGITSSTVSVNTNTTFSCLGGINADKISSYDTSQESDITYQWYVDGTAVSNGTRQTTVSATTFTNSYGIGDHSITLPDDATNVSITVTGAAGGSGGGDDGGVGGGSGEGRTGKFSIGDGGRVLTINVGGRGGNGVHHAGNAAGGNGGDTSVSGGDGGKGGNSGQRGRSGAGGGGGAGVYVYDSVSAGYIISAGGGGGGGGGAWKCGTAEEGGNGGNWQSVSGSLTGFGNGANGTDMGGGDGAGGGGGGGGYRGGSGGGSQGDCADDGGDGGGCFTGDTVVLLQGSPTVILDDSSHYEKPISEVKVGEYVVNKDKKEANKVVFIEKHAPGALMDENLYSPTEDLEPFATYNHGLYINGKWVAVDTDCFPWFEHFNIQPVENPISKPIGDNRELYNLWLTGDGTYIVNGYGTHCGLYDGGWMTQCWEQKLLTHEEVMNFLYEYGIHKEHLKTGAYLTTRILGKFNNKLLNRFGVYMMKADDSTLRKKIAEGTMKILQTVWRRFK